MKAWKKTSPELVAAFDKALPTSPGVTRRPMFGYASAFVNGNMFAGTFQDSIVVRLSERDRVALLKMKGAASFEHAQGAWRMDRPGPPVRARSARQERNEDAPRAERWRDAHDRKAGDRQEEGRDEDNDAQVAQRQRTSAASVRID